LPKGKEIIPSVAISPLGCIQTEGKFLRNSTRLFSSGSSAQQLITWSLGHMSRKKSSLAGSIDRSSRARPGSGFSFRPAISPEPGSTGIHLWLSDPEEILPFSMSDIISGKPDLIFSSRIVKKEGCHTEINPRCLSLTRKKTVALAQAS
jgi:hypothetical protein